MCPICKNSIKSTDNFCRTCLADLRPFQTKCDGCGAGFIIPRQDINYCPFCWGDSFSPPAEA